MFSSSNVRKAKEEFQLTNFQPNTNLHSGQTLVILGILKILTCPDYIAVANHAECNGQKKSET